MAIDYRAITDELASVAQRTGLFDTVNKHEPKSAPGKGLHCSVFYMGKRPSLRSGLRSTSVVARWMIQVECSMKREPEDDIDIDLTEAADAILSALHGGYKLDVAGVRGIDLLGSDGNEGVVDEAGYIPREQGLMYRVIGITVPVIINDAFDQAE
jgi:hypothetical protein